MLSSAEEAKRLLEQGALRLDWGGSEIKQQRIILTAIGSYQLEEVLKASTRLTARDVPHSVVCMLEPGKFRTPRSDGERVHSAPAKLISELYPDSVAARLFITHTRPEPIMGLLQTLNTGRDKTAALGFINQGGTLTVAGMLFVNRCTWAHILEESARLLSLSKEELLTKEQQQALAGQASPEGVIIR